MNMNMREGCYGSLLVNTQFFKTQTKKLRMGKMSSKERRKAII